jgi:hypothetical protein
MRILLDVCLPRQLRRDLVGHDVRTVAAMGWAGIRNGALLRLAEGSFNVFVTIDQNIPYQQALRGMSIAMVILSAVDHRIETLQPLMGNVLAAIDQINPGEVVRITAAG